MSGPLCGEPCFTVVGAAPHATTEMCMEAIRSLVTVHGTPMMVSSTYLVQEDERPPGHTQPPAVHYIYGCV